MNIVQILGELTKEDETLLEQMRKGYEAYKSADSRYDRIGFALRWVELVGPVLAMLSSAEHTLNEIGDLVGYDGTTTPVEAVRRAMGGNADILRRLTALENRA